MSIRNIHARLALLIACFIIFIAAVAIAETNEDAQETIRQLQRQLDALREQVSPSQSPYFPLLDNQNGTITDTAQGLMWTKRQVHFDNFSYHPLDATYARIHEEIHNKVKNFRGAGYTDWRLPTVEELRLLYNSLGMMTAYRSTDEKNRMTLPFAWTSDDIITSDSIFVNNEPQRLGLNFRNGNNTRPDYRHGAHTALLVRKVGGEVVEGLYGDAGRLLQELPVYSAHMRWNQRKADSTEDYRRLGALEHQLWVETDSRFKFGSDRPDIQRRFDNKQAEVREARAAYIRQHQLPINEASKVLDEIKAKIISSSSLEGLWLSHRTPDVRSAKDYKFVMNGNGRVIILCHDTFTSAVSGQDGSYEEYDNGGIIMRFPSNTLHTGSIDNDRTRLTLHIDGEDRDFRREWNLHRDIRMWQ